MPDILDIDRVRHRFGTVTALSGVHLSVGAGECVALLGPNGAGKTTLIGLATGLLAVQDGRVQVCGRDPRRAATRRHLGVVQQSMGFPRTLTVGELVHGWALRAGRSATAVDPVLAEVGITELRGWRAAKLSGGQQQRLALAMALVGEPDLLLLDEPTVGLDVTARRAFWHTLAARRDAGVGVLLCTHAIEEAAAVADRVVVLHRGRVVAADTPAGLTAQLPDRTITARTSLDDAALRAFDGVLSVRRDGDRVWVATAEPEAVLRAWLAADGTLTEGGAVVLEIVDDGVGGEPREGNGLAGMRERIAALGGNMTRGVRDGTAITVTVRLPHPVGDRHDVRAVGLPAPGSGRRGVRLRPQGRPDRPARRHGPPGARRAAGGRPLAGGVRLGWCRPDDGPGA